MYNQSDDFHSSSKNPVQCQHGWDYDDTWFSLTVPSQMSWVCDNRHVTNDVLFYAQNIGVALGLLFGYIGDRWFPESPRWLACRGREEDALRLLKRIATTNGGQLPPYARQVMRNVGKAQRDRKGFLSLFSSWNVFKNTVLLITARSTHLLTLQSIVMMSGGVGVNPFLSVAAQGAIQLPAYCVVHFTAACFGRCWSAVGSALLSGIAAAAVSFMLTANFSGLAITLMMVITQFFRTGTNGMANLQSVEVHHTCLRQIAACVEWTAAGVVMSALPYVALMELILDRQEREQRERDREQREKDRDKFLSELKTDMTT
ncbi:solute carrier family 22 member 13-like [Schistocerca americana]|uniref:solute carrier family 22 member 13-like n=1 Tax=Schistocerca americana TaxID=7009 RepID=UPI001F4FFFF4|nr:solute carrier family 22 member 13-like [Schistocerca americana]